MSQFETNLNDSVNDNRYNSDDNNHTNNNNSNFNSINHQNRNNDRDNWRSSQQRYPNNKLPPRFQRRQQYENNSSRNNENQTEGVPNIQQKNVYSNFNHPQRKQPNHGQTMPNNFSQLRLNQQSENNQYPNNRMNSTFHSKDSFHYRDNRSYQNYQNQPTTSYQQHNNFNRNFRNQNNYSRHQEKNPFSSSSSRNQNRPFFSRNDSNLNKHRNQTNDRIEPESQREIMDELLRKAKYECMVCCETIKIHDRTWNCQSCCNVFHLKCIQQWARSSVKSSQNNQQTPQTNNSNGISSNQASSSTTADMVSNLNSDNWRCPTCQKEQQTFPSVYYCFCGKTRNPEMSHSFVPHSCGEVCQRQLTSYQSMEQEKNHQCIHNCNLLCHPGKCPPCNRITRRTCACKKTEVEMKCLSNDKVECNEICGKVLDCGQHRCLEKCHFGKCSPCVVTFDKSCFCGRALEKNIPCSKSFEEFSCLKVCGKKFDCNAHTCSKSCHPGSCGPCPFDPKYLKHCSCEKTLLSQIPGYVERTKCTDPIAVCGKICDKELICGSDKEPHQCKAQCHSGTCPPCSSSTLLRCDCGANSQKIDCKDLTSRSFQCKRKCNKKLSCGRHKCLNQCCIDRDHICKQTCGRKLSCGLHNCSDPCHLACSPCPNVVWTEVSCNCGSEILYPPLPCNQAKPQCTRICSRQHSCVHEPKHPCHDERECPPCTELVSKLCYGSHNMVNSVPCYQTGVSCGSFCMKPMPCQLHNCIKICHSGDCPTCVQKCPVERFECLHKCSLPCHKSISQECPRSLCKKIIDIQCECKFKINQVECHTILGSQAFQAMLKNLQKKFIDSGLSYDELCEMVRSNACNSLPCDGECLKDKRQKELAKALGIDPNASPFLPLYPNEMKNFAQANPEFVHDIDEKFVELIKAFKKTEQKTFVFTFPVMNRNNRQFIHQYAGFFHLKTESVDKEPNRSVQIRVDKASFVPKLSLLEAAKINADKPKPSIVKFKTASEEAKNKIVPNHFDD